VKLSWTKAVASDAHMHPLHSPHLTYKTIHIHKLLERKWHSGRDTVGHGPPRHRDQRLCARPGARSHRPPQVPSSPGPIGTSSTSLSPNAAAGADIHMHSRRLSAGTVVPHLAASNAVWCRRAASVVDGCMMQIIEDVMGTYFWMPFHGVLIWNWMTGEELVMRLIFF